MARPFLASVPLALVLLASLIVPVALTPGTFGFHSWPTAAPERVVHAGAPDAPAPVAIAPERRRAQAQEHGAKPARGTRNLVAVRTPGEARAAAPRGGTRAATPVTTRGSTPPASPTSGGPGGGTPDVGPGQSPTAPATDLPAPTTPAGEAVDEAPAPPVEVAQNGDLPVLREDPPEAVTEPPAEDEDSHWWQHGRALGHGHERDCAEDDQEAPTEGS